MLINNLSIPIAIIFLLIFTNAGTAETNPKLLKYGLEFGIEKKDAKKILENAGYGKVEDVSDSKDIDNIVLEGSVVEGVEAVEDADTQSELEFFEDELMSAKVSYNAGDVPLLKQLENKYLRELMNKYGEPGGKEDVMGITSWMWELGQYKILLNSNSRKKRLGLSCLYLPLVAKKSEKELKNKLKGKPYDVVNDKLLK